MTKFIGPVILILAVCFSIMAVDHVMTEEKIESFCTSNDTLTRDECLFLVEYMKKNASPEIRREFMGVVKSNQDFRAHPSLILPTIAAFLEYEKLEK